MQSLFKTVFRNYRGNSMDLQSSMNRQSLKEEKCTMDAIATYVDTINVQYMQKDISYEQGRKLFKMQAIKHH